MIRAAKLDVSLYEEVEADKSSLRQAMGVVVLASLAAGIGQVFRDGPRGLILGTISALAGWYIWAYVTYFIGTRFFPEPQIEADHGQLLRTTGFSSSPGLLRIFGIIPVLGGIVVAHTTRNSCGELCACRRCKKSSRRLGSHTTGFYPRSRMNTLGFALEHFPQGNAQKEDCLLRKQLSLPNPLD